MSNKPNVTKKMCLLLFLSFVTLSTYSQYKFVVPTQYAGVLADVTNNARSEALGRNTVTLDGIRSAFDNPASISPGDNKYQLAINYSKGHSYKPKSYYPFAGFKAKITSRISLGISTHHWIDPKSYWDAIIASQTFVTNKQKNHVYSFIAAAEILKGLHFGVSGNLLRESAIDDKITGKDFVMNAGVIYDRPISLIKNQKVNNQQVRLAASLFNTLMDGQMIQRANDSVWQYRDIPVILRLGGAYSCTLPLNISFAKKSKKLKDASQTLDLSARIQYNNWLKNKDHIYVEHESQTMIGFGLEAVALNLLALRLGYFNTTAAEDNDPNLIYVTKDAIKGFTWGLGFIIPANKWSSGKVPFEVKFDVVAKNLPDWLDEARSTRISKDFTDKKLFLSLGLELNFSK